jgi:hypothetical protein
LKTTGKEQVTFQAGQSGNPAGRPKGVKNRSTSSLRALIDTQAEEIIAVLVNAARNGDIRAARTLLDRVLPPLRSGVGDVELPLTWEQPLTAAADAVIQAVSDGRLTPSDAMQIGALLKVRADLTELAELERRLASLETELRNRK